MSKETDPVCGMSVDSSSPYAATHDGHTYHFCSEVCKDKFELQPSQYSARKKGVGGEQADQVDPPHTISHGMAAPKFGFAGSGGAEYEQIRERPAQGDKR
jgi:Cu+-exporting ATPase